MGLGGLEPPPNRLHQAVGGQYCSPNSPAAEMGIEKGCPSVRREFSRVNCSPCFPEKQTRGSVGSEPRHALRAANAGDFVAEVPPPRMVCTSQQDPIMEGGKRVFYKVGLTLLAAITFIAFVSVSSSLLPALDSWQPNSLPLLPFKTSITSILSSRLPGLSSPSFSYLSPKGKRIADAINLAAADSPSNNNKNEHVLLSGVTTTARHESLAAVDASSIVDDQQYEGKGHENLRHRVKFGSGLFFSYCATAIGLVLFSGLASGLTVGFLSLDPLQLRVLEEEGTEDERNNVRAVARLVRRHHLLLVTLLLANSVALEALPIFLDRVMPSWAAVLMSVTAILLFGEIIPQAFCTGPNQLAVAQIAAPFVNFLIVILFVVAWPIAKLLDYVLGNSDHHSYYARAHLKALIRMHERQRRVKEAVDKGEEQSDVSSALGTDEVVVIEGALDLATKTLAELMVPIDRVFMLEFNTPLNREVFAQILHMGHSRIPIFKNTRKNVKGLLLTKSLLSVDPDEGIVAGQLIGKRRPIFAAGDSNVYDLLNEFQKGNSHIAFVTSHTELYVKAFKEGVDVPDTAELKGIVTLEDVIEELIQEEIYDEFDRRGGRALAFSDSFSVPPDPDSIPLSLGGVLDSIEHSKPPPAIIQSSLHQQSGSHSVGGGGGGVIIPLSNKPHNSSNLDGSGSSLSGSKVREYRQMSTDRMICTNRTPLLQGMKTSVTIINSLDPMDNQNINCSRNHDEGGEVTKDSLIDIEKGATRHRNHANSILISAKDADTISGLCSNQKNGLSSIMSNSTQGVGSQRNAVAVGQLQSPKDTHPTAEPVAAKLSAVSSLGDSIKRARSRTIDSFKSTQPHGKVIVLKKRPSCSLDKSGAAATSAAGTLLASSHGGGIFNTLTAEDAAGAVPLGTSRPSHQMKAGGYNFSSEELLKSAIDMPSFCEMEHVTLSRKQGSLVHGVTKRLLQPASGSSLKLAAPHGDTSESYLSGEATLVASPATSEGEEEKLERFAEEAESPSECEAGPKCKQCVGCVPSKAQSSRLLKLISRSGERTSV